MLQVEAYNPPEQCSSQENHPRNKATSFQHTTFMLSRLYNVLERVKQLPHAAFPVATWYMDFIQVEENHRTIFIAEWK